MARNNVVIDSSRISKIKDILTKLIPLHFKATLGTEPDVANIVNALIKLESNYNVNAITALNPRTKGTTGYNYINSSAVKIVFETGTGLQKQHIEDGLRALGLMQVMGWNLVKGGSPSGLCEIDRIRPDLSSGLVVNPGDDIQGVMLGEVNMEKAILAGLIVLEGKFKATYSTGRGFAVKGDPYMRLFPSKISGAVAAYLGLGKADMNGTTPEAYTASIVGGRMYALANGGNPYQIASTRTNIISQNGPNTNGIGQNRVNTIGCG